MFIMDTKWDIMVFFWNIDFSLWKVKVEDILIQQKRVNALKGEENIPLTPT